MKVSGKVVGIDSIYANFEVQIQIENEVEPFWVTRPSLQCILTTAFLASRSVEVEYNYVHGKNEIFGVRLYGPDGKKSFQKKVKVSLTVEVEIDHLSGDVMRSKYNYGA